LNSGSCLFLFAFILILGSSVLIDASRHLNHSLANGPNFRSRLTLKISGGSEEE
jgi:hypothetical protein